MRYPSGPPAFWLSNARNAQVQSNAALQDKLDSDPAYAQEYLRTGQPPSTATIQGQFQPQTPGSPIGYQTPVWSPQTYGLMQQQANQKQANADYLSRISQMLQGLKQAYPQYG